MKACRFAVFALFLALLALPSFGQSSTPICSLPKYANSIACLPTLVANNGALVQDADLDGNIYKSYSNAMFSVPFGLGSQYASQIATSPSAATSAGYVFSFENGALSAKPADLGPLLSDLPQTIGRNRLYIGTSYQWMEISKTGGKSLNSFIYQEAWASASYVGTNGIQASSSLKMHSIDTYLTYGITDRLEISAILPWSKVNMSINTSCPAGEDGAFLDANGNVSCLAQILALKNAKGQTVDYQVISFVPQQKWLSANGLGDVTLRAKYELLKKARQGLALGTEYRLATGDPLNMHGSGAIGVRPFLAWSYDGRVSPHANLGFQYNGRVIDDVRDDNPAVNPNPTTTTLVEFTDKLTPSKLPNIFTVSFGADFAVNSRLNLNADLLIREFSNDGSQVWNYSFLGMTANQTNSGTPLFNGVKEKATFVLGEKGKITDHLLFSANLMIDASNNGMSYKPSPIATLSYDFGGGSKK